jgi:hypothetical protein
MVSISISSGLSKLQPGPVTYLEAAIASCLLDHLKDRLESHSKSLVLRVCYSNRRILITAEDRDIEKWCMDVLAAKDACFILNHVDFPISVRFSRPGR